MQCNVMSYIYSTLSQVNFSDPNRTRHPKNSYHWFKQYVLTQQLKASIGSSGIVENDSSDSSSRGSRSSASDGSSSSSSRAGRSSKSESRATGKGTDHSHHMKCSVSNIWSCQWTDLLLGIVQSSNDTYISLSW